MTPAWSCPKCKRRFTRKNQRHACGTGQRADILRNRPPEIVALYAALEKFAKTLGPVEFVTRERYALLRSRRIFVDLTVTPDALRLVIHLPRRVRDERFEKVAGEPGHASHVVKLRELSDLRAMQKYLREAYAHSLT